MTSLQPGKSCCWCRPACWHDARNCWEKTRRRRPCGCGGRKQTRRPCSRHNSGDSEQQRRPIHEHASSLRWDIDRRPLESFLGLLKRCTQVRNRSGRTCCSVRGRAKSVLELTNCRPKYLETKPCLEGRYPKRTRSFAWPDQFV